jgi:hypothetical protein
MSPKAANASAEGFDSREDIPESEPTRHARATIKIARPILRIVFIVAKRKLSHACKLLNL